MNILQDAVQALAAAAHWTPPVPDADGGYVFRLENDLDFMVSSPDSMVCILRAELTRLPSDVQAAESLLEHCAALVVAACHKRRSVLSVYQNTLALHRTLPLCEARACLADDVRAFLNDFTWWKAQTGGGAHKASAFTFTMPQSFLGR